MDAEEKSFLLHWLDGREMEIIGHDAVEAFRRAGISEADKRAISSYKEITGKSGEKVQMAMAHAHRRLGFLSKEYDGLKKTLETYPVIKDEIVELLVDGPMGTEALLDTVIEMLLEMKR